MRWVVAAIVLAFNLTATPAIAEAPRVIRGPIPASVERVIDGDTIEVRADVWIGQQVVVRVRLAHVDTPELNARCETERVMAEAARKLVTDLIAGTRIELLNIRGGKYFGRVIADVRTADGFDLSDLVLQSGLGRPYHPRAARAPWC